MSALILCSSSGKLVATQIRQYISNRIDEQLEAHSLRYQSLLA